MLASSSGSGSGSGLGNRTARPRGYDASMSYRPGFQRGFGGFGGLMDGTPPPRDLLVLLGVLFATFSLQFFEGPRALLELFSLNGGVFRGYLWQLVTYPFVATATSGLWFLLELLILFWFGRTVFVRLGRRRFWQVLMTAAIGASVAAVLVEWIAISVSPSFVHAPFLAMLGQRMVLTILIAAFATIFGDATILLFFVLPVKARWFLWLEILFAFVFYFLPVKDLAGFVGTCVAVFLTYSSLQPGGPQRVLRVWRKRMEERILRARLGRMRRRRRFDVIEGDKDDYIHCHGSRKKTPGLVPGVFLFRDSRYQSALDVVVGRRIIRDCCQRSAISGAKIL